MSRSAKRAADNEDAFRRANETLELKADELGVAQSRTPYLCECEQASCTQVIQLERDEYEAVRSHSRRFVMVPGHQEPQDQVVREGRGFTVIEKTGEEGALVEKLDPR